MEEHEPIQKDYKKLFYNAFPEEREKDLLVKQLESAQECARIRSVRVEPETIKISTCCEKVTESEYLEKFLDHALIYEIAKQLILRGLVRVVTTPDRLLNDMVNIEATVCAIYPGDLEEADRNEY